jgi:hypothetical protein
MKTTEISSQILYVVTSGPCYKKPFLSRYCMILGPILLASVTVYFKHCHQNASLLFDPVKLNYTEGTHFHSVGSCDLKLHNRTCLVTQSVQVIRDIQRDAIMGKDFLCQQSLQENPENHSIFWAEPPPCICEYVSNPHCRAPGPLGLQPTGVCLNWPKQP